MNSKWSEMIRMQPDARVVAERSARARLRALAAWKRPGSKPVRRQWPGAVLAFSASVAAALLLLSTPSLQPPLPAPAAAPSEPQRLVMKMQLSDGTQLQWTFDDRFSML